MRRCRGPAKASIGTSSGVVVTPSMATMGSIYTLASGTLGGLPASLSGLISTPFSSIFGIPSQLVSGVASIPALVVLTPSMSVGTAGLAVLRYLVAGATGILSSLSSLGSLGTSILNPGSLAASIPSANPGSITMLFPELQGAIGLFGGSAQALLADIGSGTANAISAFLPAVGVFDAVAAGGVHAATNIATGVATGWLGGAL